jgi:predicted transcriptional regulator
MAAMKERPGASAAELAVAATVELRTATATLNKLVRDGEAKKVRLGGRRVGFAAR